MAKLTQCPNGHFYDMERSPQCPYCGQSEAQQPMPPVDGADAGQTAPLQEETMNKTQPLNDTGMGRTQPLNDTGMGRTQPLNDTGVGKTQPLYDAGTDRTRPLDEVPMAPPPLRREADWQRMLLLAAAGLAAACTLFSLIDLMRWLLQ